MRTSRISHNATHRWKNEKRNIVFIIKNDDLKKSIITYVQKNFSIYQVLNPQGSLKYEIVYNASKIFSLLRVSESALAENYIKQMRNIIPTLLQGVTSPKPSLCQPVIDAIINNPNWTECHIAASVGKTGVEGE